MAYLEILIAAAAAFILGFGWYTALFGKAWQAETGVTDEQAESGIAITHGTAFLMMCFIAFGINFVVNMHDLSEQTFAHGAFHGALSCMLYGLPVLVIHYMYQKKSAKLIMIDGGFILVIFSLMGGILGLLKLGVA